MKFTASISFWVKHYFSARNLVILVLLAIVLLYGVYKGAEDWQIINSDSNDFKLTEALIFNSIISYDEYSDSGIRVFYSSPVSGIFFFNQPLFYELAGKVNSIITVNISSDCKNRSIFKGNSPLRFRFSDLVLVFAGLAVIGLALAKLASCISCPVQLPRSFRLQAAPLSSF